MAGAHVAGRPRVGGRLERGTTRTGPWVVAGIVAGLVGLVGLSAVYRGMAIGVVSVVSTIAATGPVVPIIIGLLLGERPSLLQFGGIVVALAGIALLAFDRRPQAEGKLLPGVGLALLAALAFGVFLVAIRYASRPDPLWGVLATRSGSVLALLLLTGHRDDRMPGAGLGVPFQQGTDDQ